MIGSKYSPVSTDKKVDRLLKIKDAVNWPLCFPSLPPCREAENLIPLAVVMGLPSGKGNPANAIHLAINAAEITAGHPLRESYWLYCDLKEGSTIEKFERLSEKEQQWIEGKLQLAGVEPREQNLEGYGEALINQLFKHNKMLGELRDLTRHHSWREVFEEFLSELCWTFVSGTRVRT
jgi:hypothetical protein